MTAVDRECDAIAGLFSRKSVKSKFPVYTRSENPIFRRKGQSFNLKNVREYQPFDDLRQIDWKLYGRTDRYYIKEFYEEENEGMLFLIDRSASLSFFDPAYYRRFIASLAYIFLKLHFTIHLVSFSHRLEETCRNIKEAKNIHRVLNFLDDLTFAGPTDLVPVLKTVRQLYAPSTVLLFSDFFDPNYRAATEIFFRRSFLIHFFTSLKELTKDFAELEIEDRERKKRIVFAYNRLNAARVGEREDRFLRTLRAPRAARASRGNTHYYLLSRDADRVPCYWRVLEDLYA
jgi:uncharacterized protein (DUF58 family)